MKNTMKAMAAMILMIGLAAPALAGAVNGDDLDDLSSAELWLADALMLGPGATLSIINSSGRPPTTGRAVSYCIVHCAEAGQPISFDTFQDTVVADDDGGPNLRYNPSQPRR